jgi:hypothetical protein
MAAAGSTPKWLASKPSAREAIGLVPAHATAHRAITWVERGDHGALHGQREREGQATSQRPVKQLPFGQVPVQLQERQAAGDDSGYNLSADQHPLLAQPVRQVSRPWAKD